MVLKKREILVGKVQEIPSGRSKKFSFKKEGDTLEAFVIHYKGNFYAYLNRCRHVSLPLDFGDNDFFSSDGKFLSCKNHGALYSPESGECVAGPCYGSFLETVPVEVREGNIYCSIR
ncbi:MAG: Rieske 2Fe-2S domain-containing protein [Elusimicrobia bacterium]|nr:Rieske 2Fe-2S domain-containing protein [Elusimicrobiota bacterium]MBI3012435.1 Rieske 2Fe-2S domain-containing protein [Elusimicrobiota bacterium]